MNILKKNVLFCISSCEKFAEKTLPKSISSLNRVGVSPSDILCALGGFQDLGKAPELISALKSRGMDANFVAVKYNSLEYNVFLYLMDNKELLEKYDYIFFMHDTCWVGPSFISLLQQNFPRYSPKTFALTPKPSMGIGLYSTYHLAQQELRIRAAENLSTEAEAEQQVKKWGVYAEDFLLLPDEGNFMQATQGYEIITMDQYPFGPQTKRRIRYFPFLDFFKAQANFQGLQPNMITDA